MRSSHANPKHRRHRSSAIALPAALLALAGAAIVPATAAAMDDQSTETGTRCIQVLPGIYLTLIPGEPCEPERPGEVIRIRDPYKPPACSPLEHRCGLPDEGRAPQPLPKSSEGGFGPGAGRGRGPGAAPTKPARDPAKPGGSALNRLTQMVICAKLMKAGGFRLDDILPGGKIRSDAEMHRAWADTARWLISHEIAQAFMGDFADRMARIHHLLESVKAYETFAYQDKKAGENPTDEVLKARDAFMKSGCNELMQPDRN